MRIQVKLACLLVLAAAAGGCRNDPAAARASDKSAAKEVRVMTAVHGALPRVVTVTGTLAAEEQAVLGMKVSGRLAEFSADLGSRVSKGQAMASLSPTDFKLRIQQAEAALQQSRSRLGLPADSTDDRIDIEKTALVRQSRAMMDEAGLRRDRARQLHKEQLVPQSELDAAEANFVVAESRYQDALEEARNRQGLLAQRRSELESARQQLNDSVLYAPFDGAVRERHAALGQFLAAGQPVFTIVRIHPLRLRLAVPERDAANIRPGQDVRVRVEGDTVTYPGRVARLSPAIDEASRTLLLEAEVPNPSGLLRPGSFATAEIVTSAPLPVVLVSESAVITFAGVEKVYIVRDGKSVEQRVRTGRRDQKQVEILEGVSAGDVVVLDPGNLVGGQAVTVIR
jgi:RND family efflux transporter MFP subunit